MRPLVPLTISLLVALGACATAAPERRDEREGSTVVYEPAPEPVKAPTPDATITIAAVGDIMLGSTYPYADGRDVPPPTIAPPGS